LVKWIATLLRLVGDTAALRLREKTRWVLVDFLELGVEAV